MLRFSVSGIVRHSVPDHACHGDSILDKSAPFLVVQVGAGDENFE